MYLKTETSKIDSQVDVYYRQIDRDDKTWKSILALIEDELDAHFLNNQGKIDGISFSIEIVKELPGDCDIGGP